MRRSFLLSLAVALSVAAAPFPQISASASCAAPGLVGSGPLVLERHTRVTVDGQGFSHGGCADSGSCTGSFGCQSCTYDETPRSPMKSVHLRLVQRGHSWSLAVADAGSAKDKELGQVSWTFEVPAGVVPGPATLVPDHSQAVRVQVR